MRAAIYNPYLDTLGGGERYTMAFANVLSKNDYEIDLEWSDNEIVNKLENKFGIKLNNIKVVKDVNKGDGYDLLFWVSDGSIPLLKARKNFLHFQIPFSGIKRNSILDRMKFFRVNKVICNSFFTKSFIDKEYGVNSDVLYPPVDVDSIKPKKKENLIIAIGRFSQLTQAKNQHVLIDVFKRMINSGLKGWKFVIAGGTEVGVGNYLIRIKKMVNSYPIQILESPNFKTIKSLFGSAKIFWSATGFGIEEFKEPIKVEHFGISTVEAMAGGAIPLVYRAGGHMETVEEGNSGFLWTKKSELIKKTMLLINNKKLMKDVAVKALSRSKKFSYNAFEKSASALLK